MWETFLTTVYNNNNNNKVYLNCKINLITN